LAASTIIYAAAKKRYVGELRSVMPIPIGIALKQRPENAEVEEFQVAAYPAASQHHGIYLGFAFVLVLDRSRLKINVWWKVRTDLGQWANLRRVGKTKLESSAVGEPNLW
jgi:hypothetical protein